MDYKQIVLYIAETKQGLRRDLIEKSVLKIMIISVLSAF